MMDIERLPGQIIYLRKLLPEDATECYVRWLNDPEVNRFLESRFVHWTVDSVRVYVLERQNPQEHFFAICDVRDGNHVGNIKIGPINPHHRNADVSLFIGEKAYWGRGVAGEAIGLVTTYAFDRLGVLKLQAGVYLANIGCIKAFQSSGYSQEGLLRERVLSGGKLDDVVILGYAVSDYRKRSSP